MKKTNIIALLLSIAALTSTPATAATFTDVPDTHWAYAAIENAVANGLVNGIGDGTAYAPEGNVTAVQFIKMVTCQFYANDIDTASGAWYVPYVNTANAKGVLTNVVADENNITRYAMAQLMYNAMKANGVTLPTNPDTSKIADWADVPTMYQTAVATCYELGLITGIDAQGTFYGAGNMTRAQAAIVIDRMVNLLSSQASTDVTTTWTHNVEIKTYPLDLATWPIDPSSYTYNADGSVTFNEEIVVVVPTNGEDLYTVTVGTTTSKYGDVTFSIPDYGTSGYTSTVGTGYIAGAYSGETAIACVGGCEYVELHVDEGTTIESIAVTDFIDHNEYPADAVRAVDLITSLYGTGSSYNPTTGVITLGGNKNEQSGAYGNHDGYTRSTRLAYFPDEEAFQFYAERDYTIWADPTTHLVYLDCGQTNCLAQAYRGGDALMISTYLYND